jgi:predicted phosphoribosyltransferase
MYLVNLLAQECNAEVEVVISPFLYAFHSIEQYHHDFQLITDEQVIRIIKDRNHYHHFRD